MKDPIPLSLWCFSLLSFSLSAALVRTEPAKVDQRRFLTPPPEHIELFSFGFRESIADSLWLRWIQDSDTCQTYVLKKKIDAAKPLDDKLFANPRHKVCDDSWGYKMLDATSRLAPRFEMIYLAGGSALAVATEDYAGASLLYDRGIEQFPHDWVLLYRASYHFLYDVQDLKRAAFLLNEASRYGAPTWLQSLAARIYTRTGQLGLGITTLENYRHGVTNPLALKEIDQRLTELKAKLAKEP